MQILTLDRDSAMLLLALLLPLPPLQAAAGLEYAAMRLVEEQQALLAVQPQPQARQVRQQQLQLRPQQLGQAPAVVPARPAGGALPGAPVAGQALPADGDEPQGQVPPQQEHQQEVQHQAQEERQQEQEQQQDQQAQQPGQPLSYDEFVGWASQLLINCGEWRVLLPPVQQAKLPLCCCSSIWFCYAAHRLSSLLSVHPAYCIIAYS
jgi:hypothetical protein